MKYLNLKEFEDVFLKKLEKKIEHRSRWEKKYEKLKFSLEDSTLLIMQTQRTEEKDSLNIITEIM